MKKVFCDRCDKDITKDWYEAGNGAGNCPECGDNLCSDCAGNWVEEGDELVCCKCAAVNNEGGKYAMR